MPVGVWCSCRCDTSVDMKAHFFFLMTIMGGLTAACTTTGAGKKKPAPVVRCMPGGGGQQGKAEPASDGTFVVAMAGDIMMGTTYPDSALPADDGRMLFADVTGILSRADIAVANLEGTLCDTSHVANKKDSEYSYAFRTPVELAPRLKEAGFDYLSMANNHALDFGYDGVASTEKALDMLGIKHSGLLGRDVCAVVERSGVRYGLCAFGHNSYTLKHRELWQVKEILDSLVSISDVVIVSFHGGGEGKAFRHLPYEKEVYLNEDRGELRRFAHFCIDNGADIVFGHGPHVVRCIELYKDRFIAYSLGNFCTPYGISIAGISGYAPVIEAEIDRQGCFLGGHIHPFIQRRGLGPRRETATVVVRERRSRTAADGPDSRLRITDDGRIERTDAPGHGG